MIIPPFRIEFDSAYRHEFRELCERIFDEQFLSDHSVVREFENEFAEFSHLPHAVAVANGTAALYAALAAVDVAGREVILPTNTFIGTASAIEAAGGIPVPVDIESTTFGLCPEAVESAITSQTAAVIAVHIGGLISPRIIDIAKICERNGLPLIEDCAHAHGCRLNETPAGAFGIAGCFSFFPTKVMSAGEGGMILTRFTNWAEKFRSVRRFGQTKDSAILFAQRGLNCKMSEFQAAAGLLDVRRSAPRLARRREIAAYYQKRLAGSVWRAVSPSAGARSTYYKQIVITPCDKDFVESHMKKNGVTLGGGVFFHPLHCQPYLQKRFQHRSFAVAENFMRHHICLPCYPELKEGEIARVADLLLEFNISAQPRKRDDVEIR